MAKFIIEVDDDFIRKNADPKMAKQKLDPNGKGINVIKGLFDMLMLAFSAIEKRIDRGETEFNVTRDMMDDDTKREYWERNVPDMLMLFVLAGSDEKKKEG